MTPHEEHNPTSYVLGFAFSPRLTHVWLITKNRPEWQAGHLNGIGGKIEPDDRSELDAMRREFAEETGVCQADWSKFMIMRFKNGAVVHCFATRLLDGKYPKSMTDEPVSAHRLVYGQLNDDDEHIALPNLHWLIPMAYQHMRVPEHERMLEPT